MKTGLFLLMFYCSFLSIPYSYPAKSWDDESCSPPILIGLWGYMPRCVFKSFTHKDGWKLNYWRKASDGQGGGGWGGGTPELDRQVQSTLILSCCRMFWGLEFSIPGVFLGRKFGKFFWFLYLCWNVFEDCCSHTATTRVYICQPRSSRVPDEEKINLYGTINKQPQIFNFLFFFFFLRYIIWSIERNL